MEVQIFISKKHILSKMQTHIYIAKIYNFEENEEEI